MAIELTIESLRDAVGDYDYRLCTGGENAVAEKAIERAIIFVKSVFKRVDRLDEYDEYDDSIAESVIHRASFELYVKGKMFKQSETKRTESQVILINLLGKGADIYKGDELTTGRVETVIAVRKGKPLGVNLDNY